jgi:amidase
MSVTLPSQEQLGEIALEVGLSLTDADIASFITLMQRNVRAYNLVDELPADPPQVGYPRRSTQRPSPEENRHNAWSCRTRVTGASEGKLTGKTVVLKDNVMFAGVPTMNGSSILQGYVPDVDATVVTRVLDAGGTIVGKAHCECYCLSGGSHTNSTGPVHNPRKMGYSAGGSSSGCAVLVALGAADMAIGSDTGGSIRIPASFSGVYGMKPTHGLVPYTGIISIDPYLDHTGPMTATVSENALLLEVIAGADGDDPRQREPTVRPYTTMLEGGVRDLRIAIVKEGFGQPNSEPDVDDNVEKAVRLLGSLGARITEVSIPSHLMGAAILSPLAIEGFAHAMSCDPDLHGPSGIKLQGGWRRRADELPENVKLILLFGNYIRKYYGDRYSAKARNLTRRLTEAYDAVLAEHDLLVMPTTPMKATRLPGPGAGRDEVVERAREMITNTAPFNVSHHPAMAVPCGLSDGLPVSMMLVGRHFDEPTIYRAAYAFEQAAI